jgi:hypothetical protein
MNNLDWTAGASRSKTSYVYIAERADVEASGAFGWENTVAMLRAYETAESGRFEAIPVWETTLLPADTKRVGLSLTSPDEKIIALLKVGEIIRWGKNFGPITFIFLDFMLKFLVFSASPLQRQNERMLIYMIPDFQNLPWAWITNRVVNHVTICYQNLTRSLNPSLNLSSQTRSVRLRSTLFVSAGSSAVSQTRE